MKGLLTALGMALGMFTILPLPTAKWDEERRLLSTCCLPVVGLVVGAIWLGVAVPVHRFLPPMLAAAFIAAAPLVLSGFIHMDGFMDTADALLSWRGREEKVRILKDVHVGAMAVVLLGVVLLFQYGASASIKRPLPLLFIPVISRCCSALAVLNLKPLAHSEYARDEEKMPGKYTLGVCIQATLALTAAALFGGWAGAISCVAVGIGYRLSTYIGVRALGGFSGDLAGFSLTLAELCGLIALAMF